MKAMAVVASRARKKAAVPKALHAVARQQLLLINGLLDEVARNYVARLHREILELTRALEQPPRPGRGQSKREKGLKSIVKGEKSIRH